MYFLCLNTLQHACYFNLNLSVCFNIDGFEVYCLCFVFWLKLYVIILRWLIRDLVSVMAPWSRNNLSMYLASHLGPLSDRLANILVSFWLRAGYWQIIWHDVKYDVSVLYCCLMGKSINCIWQVENLQTVLGYRHV